MRHSYRLTLVGLAVVFLSSCSVATQSVVLNQGGITGTPADAILVPLLVNSAYSKKKLPTVEYGPSDYEIAVEEINKGILDKDLWGEALIDAECDETKRKSSYLELRKNQLREARRANLNKLRADQELREKQLNLEKTEPYDAEVNISSDSSGDARLGNEKELNNLWAVDLSGNYTSTITSNSNFSFVKRYQELNINVIQTGNCITAFDDRYKTKISGAIVGSIVKFHVNPGQASGFYDAEGEWRINAENTGFKGNWKSLGGPDAGSGNWNLTKIE